MKSKFPAHFFLFSDSFKKLMVLTFFQNAGSDLLHFIFCFQKYVLKKIGERTLSYFF